MIRHARAAVLAGAVLCIAQPAAAVDADWWQLDQEVERGETARYLADAGSAREVSPGVTELRVLMHIQRGPETTGWVDAALRLDCAKGRRQTVRMTEYDAELTVLRASELEDWLPLPRGHPIDRFVCQGERAGFQPREDFTAPGF